MAGILALGALVTVVVGTVGGVVVGFLYGIPFQKWSFQHRGHSITVRNYALRETIEVDGAVQADTRCDGDSMTWAHHVVSLDGAPLHIGVRSENGVSVHCEAADGPTLVFDSRDRRRLLARAASTVQAVEPDARDVALSALVTELSHSDDPEVMARAEALGNQARRLLARIAQTQRASELHTALGGGQEVAVLLGTLESELSPVLAELRALHLGGTAPMGTELPRLPQSGSSAAAADLEPRQPIPLKATV